jgi:hypothetical protein
MAALLRGLSLSRYGVPLCSKQDGLGLRSLADFAFVTVAELTSKAGMHAWEARKLLAALADQQ